MVMATLFAESHTFPIANQPVAKPRQGSRAPGWADKSFKRFAKREKARVISG